MDATTSIDEFFQVHVDRACRRAGLHADPRTEHYLVRLLTGYAAQQIDDTPLALKLCEALGAGPQVRTVQLREIGDTSLYVSGFWAESFERKLIDVDYYIGMGESAYGQLASHQAVSAPSRHVFFALAQNFARFVRVLSLISETVMPRDNANDVIRLYERWVATGSQWARKRLAALGVMLPGPDDKQEKNLQ